MKKGKYKTTRSENYITGMQDVSLQIGKMVRVFPDQVQQSTLLSVIEKAIDRTGIRPHVDEAASELLGRAALVVMQSQREQVDEAIS
jgi:predicted flavoprotein YhiN